jgi:oxygen-independent coproporphyrinogen-3 oxidase
MGGVENLEQPELGNYFVAAYPPFFYWREGTVDEDLADLNLAPAVQPPALGLYVHIPFCVERCQYCYYLSSSARAGNKGPYIDALIGELKSYSVRPAFRGRLPRFVYFGGGTPSLLSVVELERLFSGLRSVVAWDAVQEVTFECAPRSVTPAKAQALHDNGVTRLSLGVQQLDDAVLRDNGRVHLCADVERAYAALRRVGFDIINLDLIVGLAGETDQSFDASLERTIALGPDSVTLYQLELPFNTPLNRAVRSGEQTNLASWPVKRARLARGFERLEAAGYTVRSAYSAVRDPQRHRFVYQDEQYRGADVLGLGASAFSYLNGVHFQNAAEIDTYMECVGASRPAVARSYRLSPDERLVRELVLQLKLGQVDLNECGRRHGADLSARFATAFAHLEAAGYMTTGNGVARLTREGLLRADRLVRELYLPEHRGSRYA